MPKDTRLIERWLPIAELGIESTRERTPRTPFPAPNRLHVWWARRPLVASRAAVLASLLPADACHEQFMRILGIHGDPVAVRNKLDVAKKTGANLGSNPYGYKRAFTYSLVSEDNKWIETLSAGKPSDIKVLDPTAGGGSIPIETSRLGFASFANDLNPVATLILKATTEWPAQFGSELQSEFRELASSFVRCAEPKYRDVFPSELEGIRIEGYLWARTITCPYCAGRIPLSPNWRLAPDGTGIRLKPELGKGPGSEGRICTFEIVEEKEDQSPETVKRGDAICPYSDCNRVIKGDEIKQQAQSGGMGEQLYAIAYKKRVETILKSGKRGKDKWVRGYRAPTPRDDNSEVIKAKLAEKLPEWEAFDIVPSERFPENSNDDRPIKYGMPLWRDLFSPRQLLCHGTSVEVFREMLEADQKEGKTTDVRKAAYVYLALSLSKLCDYNSRMCLWIADRSVIGHTFSQHDFSFKWSYAEMAPLIVGLGYDWAIRETTKCIGELITLLHPEAHKINHNEDLFATDTTPPPITISCKSGDSLDHIEGGSIEAVVMDPPYYDNVMYAELSDFFYVWLKRTAGHVFPELFRRHLTDKENEAVANPARFKDQKGAKALAGQDYQERMASVFTECRRVLKPNGILTLMFMHKATDAWDALTKGLMEAGFIVTASWPVNSEAEGSLHIKNKAAAKSMIFLVCRPRPPKPEDSQEVYWEDVEPKVAEQVQNRIDEFQAAGIAGVDLYLASFGPALEEFSRHWPLKRGSPKKQPEGQRKRQIRIFPDDDWDPYAVTPEDALNVARREVRHHRLEQLAHLEAKDDMDPATAFFILAWDAFRAPEFSFDEALRLARAVGVDLDKNIVGKLAKKKGSNIVLWSSGYRAATGTLGSPDGSRGLIDTIHHAANLARMRSLDAAKEMLDDLQMGQDDRFAAAMEAVLEVLPVGKSFSGMELESEVKDHGGDFEALYKLSRLLHGEQFKEPKQLEIWQDETS